MGGNITGSRRDGPRGAAQQIARIAALLGEIEELSRHAPEISYPLLSQTRDSLEKARSVLKCHPPHAVSQQEDDDPQPDVDNDLLDRMYGVLAAGRRPAER